MEANWTIEAPACVATLQWRERALEAKVAELERENRRLREMAYQDELTGLDNRRGFWAHLEYAINFAGRYGGAVSVLLLDLDGMKRVNDTAGHPEGDRLLQRVGDVLRLSLRNTDLAARLGGDEFGVVLPNTDGAAASIVAERIRQRIAELGGIAAGCSVSASVGIATALGTGRDERAAHLLVARADSALYAAKRQGRNRVERGERSLAVVGG
jgi:diguanylate cyclase (GGDEF)-like protein